MSDNTISAGLEFRNSVDQMVDHAASFLDLGPGVIEAIKSCTAVLQVTFPVKIDDRVESFTGWRAVHSIHRLPSRVVFAMPLQLTRTRSRLSQH